MLFDKRGNPKYSIGERTFNIINVKINIRTYLKFLFILIFKSRISRSQLMIIASNINTTDKYITVVKRASVHE